MSEIPTTADKSFSGSGDLDSLVGDSRPIGVFDSGIGGLTVLRELIKAFPNESFEYLGDTARLPYGSKSPETILRYLTENIQFLVRRNCKYVVVACNSASSQISNLKESFNVPIFSVIEPGVLAAAQTTRSGRIGLIATEATVKSRSYQNRLVEVNPSVQVFAQACPLFVPLVEEGWTQDPVTNLIVYRYLQKLKLEEIDTLILGCTHYPLLRGAIENVMGRSVELIDSGAALASLLKSKNTAGVAHSKEVSPQKREPSIKLSFTDLSDRTQNLALRVLEDFNVSSTKRVTFENVTLDTIS